jgi:uncharacterized protein YqfA (UPF0365 family)
MKTLELALHTAQIEGYSEDFAKAQHQAAERRMEAMETAQNLRAKIRAIEQGLCEAEAEQHRASRAYDLFNQAEKEGSE